MSGVEEAGAAAPGARSGATGSGTGPDQLLDHEYDGIREYDNPLPGWWNQIFIATIIFAVAYFAYYHSGGEGKTMAEWYAVEAKEADDLKARLALSAPKVTAELIASIRADERRLRAGRETFALRCVSCHLAEGQGLVGPNLTDAYWIHGKGGLVDIYTTVKVGVPEKGMISWESQLSQDQILDVTAFVSTLRGTSPPNPKAPQGEKVDGIHD